MSCGRRLIGLRLLPLAAPRAEAQVATFTATVRAAIVQALGVTPQRNLDFGNVVQGVPEAIATIKTHSRAVMTAAGYTPIRTWPAWSPQCANCHDPHGDGNLSMVSRWAYDKAAFNLPAGVGGAPYTGALPTENTTLVFTDATTGADTGGGSYADLDAPYSSVCQECHEDGSVVSFHDGTTAAGANHPGTGTNPGDCSGCHKHSTGFMPEGCESCHNGNPSYPLAPNVIDGTLPGSASLSYNYYGTDGTKQDGGHGDPEGRDNLVAKPECTSCHDVSQPPGNLHMNGTYESIWNNTMIPFNRTNPKTMCMNQ